MKVRNVRSRVTFEADKGDIDSRGYVRRARQAVAEARAATKAENNRVGLSAWRTTAILSQDVIKTPKLLLLPAKLKGDIWGGEKYAP